MNGIQVMEGELMDRDDAVRRAVERAVMDRDDAARLEILREVRDRCLQRSLDTEYSAVLGAMIAECEPKPIKVTLEFWKPSDAPLSPDIWHIAAIRYANGGLAYYAELPTLAQIEEAGK